MATNVRDFNIAASPSWKTTVGRSVNGKTKIFVHSRKHDGKRLLKLAKAELARYRKLTGVPYPYPSGSWAHYFRYVQTDGAVNAGAGLDRR